MSTTPLSLFLMIASTEGVVSKEDKKVAVAEDIPSKDISLVGHSIMAFAFVGLVIAYTCFSVVAFMDRPEVEVFSQQRSSLFPPMSINITSTCSNPPHCKTMTITSNWSGAVSSSTTFPCAASSGVFAYPNASQLIKPYFTATTQLCYVADQSFTTATPDPLAIQGINVDMILNPGEVIAAERASGTIVVSTADGKLNRLVNLDTWQVKTLVLGMTVKRRDDEIVEQSLYPIAIQYDGKRPNWRSSLIISLNQVANVYDVSRPGTALDVISSIGGAAGLIAAVFCFWSLSSVSSFLEGIPSRLRTWLMVR